MARVSRQMAAMAARRMGKSRAEFDGPGTPVYLMQERTEHLLTRVRPTLPFPVPIDQFLMTVYPSQLFQPIPNREAIPWDNLAACVNTGEVAHFSVDGRGEHETFWVRHPRGELLPSPADVSATLKFEQRNPHFGIVAAWLDRALATQFELLAVHEKAAEFIRLAQHPKHIEQYWPELYAFVGAFLEGKVKDPLPKINTRALELPIKRVRDEITTMLAKCSMLPDAPCKAWVQYPRGD